jgi:argininosuccinate synthase
VTGRQAPKSLYQPDLVTFEEGAADYNQADAHGFIRLNALRLRVNRMVADQNDPD